MQETSFVLSYRFYIVGSKSFCPDIQKLHKMEDAARDRQYILKGIDLLVRRCGKCVEIEGDYIEK
jgi:hypothetical protein